MYVCTLNIRKEFSRGVPILGRGPAGVPLVLSLCVSGEKKEVVINLSPAAKSLTAAPLAP